MRKRNLFVGAAAATAILVGASAVINNNSESSSLPGYTVNRVVDGDTVHVLSPDNKDVTIRVLGIDTPETVNPHTPIQRCGPEASARAKELMPKGTSLVLYTDPTQDNVDRYGRSLRYINATIPGHKNRSDVGRLLIQEGLARVYVFKKPFKRLDAYTRAQTVAQRHNRGIWGKDCKTNA